MPARSFAPSTLALLLVACGPTLDGPEMDAETQASTTAPASTSADGAEETAAPADSSGGEASTSLETTGEDGPPLWTVASHTYASVGCFGADPVPSLYLEAIPEDQGSADCNPAPDVDIDPVGEGGIIIVRISPWDGEGGTFTIDHEQVSASANLTPDPAVGELTLEVSEPWAPTTLWFSIDGLEGRLELAQCLNVDDELPCDGG